MNNIWGVIRTELSMTNKHILWIIFLVGILIGMWVPLKGNVELP